jgi:hypothetical protein
VMVCTYGASKEGVMKDRSLVVYFVLAHRMGDPRGAALRTRKRIAPTETSRLTPGLPVLCVLDERPATVQCGERFDVGCGRPVVGQEWHTATSLSVGMGGAARSVRW